LMMAVYEQPGSRGETIRPLTRTVENFGRLAAASDADLSDVIQNGCSQILSPAHVNASLAIVRNNTLYAFNKAGANIAVVDRDGQVQRLEERPMQVQERALDTLGMVIVGNPVFMESIGD